jgi:hypothetical protein
VRRLVFFYDNLEVFVAHKVIGRDLAIGFRGVGMNEARPILEPAIRRGREIRKMGSPSSTRILSTSSVRDRPRRYTASSGCTGFPPTTQSGTRRTWPTRTELFGGARDLIVSLRSSVFHPGRPPTSARRLASDTPGDRGSGAGILRSAVPGGAPSHAATSSFLRRLTSWRGRPCAASRRASGAAISVGSGTSLRS